MATYCIAVLDDNEDQIIDKLIVPCPDIVPVSGDILEFSAACYALANSHYNVGDELILLGRTTRSSHGLISSLGNWVVKCKDRVSVWTNIEWSMAENRLKQSGKKLSRETAFMKLRREGSFEIYESESLDLRMARPHQGGHWVLSDLKNTCTFDQDRYRHDLAERYGLKLDLNHEN
jgi:hypothetical protein